MSPPILADVCLKITGRPDYTIEFDNTGYNIGRLAVLEYEGRKNFISFSEVEITSRNSSFQSFPSALSRYILDESPNKGIYFYFLPGITGNWETPYFQFMYRLMRTANVNFLNSNEYLTNTITPFSSIEDIMLHKEDIRRRNSGNRSTYLTRGPRNQFQIFGKTYGANKYETTILCIAISTIATTEVELYQIGEGGLSELPQMSKDAIEHLGIIHIYTSNRNIERVDFEDNDSLRSAQYIYNLLEKLGDKKCAFCECNIPQIIQGAHIWPVSEIKRENHLTQDEKLNFALDGNNGLWLCNNHHKLFDTHILRLFENRSVKYRSILSESQSNYIRQITSINELPESFVNEDFTEYINKRNYNISESLYMDFAD